MRVGFETPAELLELIASYNDIISKVGGLLG